MEDYLIILATILFCYWYWTNSKSTKNLPPGPTGLPFLGYLPFMKAKQNLSFVSLKEKYGDVYSLKFGQALVIVLSSYESVKEAYVKQGQIFVQRPVLMTGGPPEFTKDMGIAFTNGKSWVDNRQLSFNHIKMFCRSMGCGESVIANETKFLLLEIKNHRGTPNKIDKLIFKSTSNIVWAFIFGERRDYDDKDFIAMLNATRVYMTSLKFSGGDIAFPWIFSLKLVQNYFGISPGHDAFREMHKYFDKIVDQMEAMPRSEKTNEYNFVEEWLRVYPKNTPKYDYYRKQLLDVTIELFLAASDIVSVTIQWAIMYMMEYPEIQQKVQNEIDEVIGKNEPTMTDKNKMLYTDATIMEVNRIVSVAAVNIPHSNSETTTLKGYRIPKGSVVIANLWGIHHDPKIYPNPDEFRPERFLENGQLKKADELMPFGLGKRQCVGELMARMEFFLFFTSLLQHFTFKKPEGTTISFDYDFAQVLAPRPHNVCAIPRN